MGDFVVQECCVHGTDLESHGPTLILCDDPLPLLTNNKAISITFKNFGKILKILEKIQRGDPWKKNF